MAQAPRRRQPPITIRSDLATVLLRRLAIGGRSQVEIIEEALERMAARHETLSQALAPVDALDFDWEPNRSNVAGHVPDFVD